MVFLETMKLRWGDLRAELTRDNLPKRIFKCVLATALTVIISLLPNIRSKIPVVPLVAYIIWRGNKFLRIVLNGSMETKDVYGTAAYLASMTTVFGHPGRRLGSMVEALILATIGTVIGVAWGSLGTYLGSLVYSYDPKAAMGIKAVFLVIALSVHGYVRSRTPRLYLMMLLMIIPVIIGLTSPKPKLTTRFPIQFFYPIFTAVAIVLLVSITIFPEYGSTYLGMKTIETLQAINTVQKDANALFVAYATPSAANSTIASSPSTQSSLPAPPKIQLKDLTSSKATLRKKVTECKAVFTECSFELAFSVLAPWELKPIAGYGIKRLVANTVSLVGACESKYALLGGGDDENQETKENVDKEEEGKQGKEDKGVKSRAEEVVGRLRPRREIESGDEQLLRYLLKRIENPLKSLQTKIDRSVDIINACVAYAYDVHTSPSKKDAIKTRCPKGILLQELDIHIDWLSMAIEEFGKSTSEALEGAAALQELSEGMDGEVDVMPREEVFLISSFMLNLRQAASHTLNMLKHSRTLVEMRQHRKERRILHFPHIKLRKWLFSGNEEQEAMPASSRGTFRDRDADQGRNLSAATSQETLDIEAEKLIKEIRGIQSRVLRFRGGVADFLKWFGKSEDVLYAFKLTLGTMLCAWPAFITSWSHWFNLNRGVWVSLIFILVFENAVGSTIWIFALRTIGTIIGSSWGYAAYQAHGGNEIVIAVMIILGTIPSFYVQLGTKYMKAGMVCTISMCVVAITTHLQTVPGTSKENFYKRSAAMLIGGSIATLVQLIVFPTKARVRLKESLASAIVQINKMESCIALGVDETRGVTSSPQLFKRFEGASKKAEAALTCAETFLTYTKQEPRLKGNFDSQAVVYKEIIFVLRQIADRMENILQLRIAYGSAVLEQYNSQVYSYRRNVAASVTLTLFACHEALTTKLPLPQFLPSARLAHLRMVVRVRQILQEEERERCNGINPSALARRRVLRLKFLSWNASSAALEECVEYVEELVDLMKMLVGANEFRSGLLHRPTYRDYVDKIRQQRGLRQEDGAMDSVAGGNGKTVSSRSLGRVTARMGWAAKDDDAKEKEIPNPLQRIQSRRAEAKLDRQRKGLSGRNT